MVSMIFLSLLGLMMIYFSSSDIDLAGQSRTQLKAFYAATAGTDRAIKEIIADYPWLVDDNNSSYLQGIAYPCASATDTQCGYVEDSLGAPLRDIAMPEGDVTYTVQGKKVYDGGALDMDRIVIYSVGQATNGIRSEVSAMVRWNPGGLEGYGGQLHGGSGNTE
ncbi:MAG: hypothetical protein HY538_03725 [Deltaproteobacteria bacterium]|nr:hypothetical protein [Deltaproteobacteria bacterium]